MDFLLKNLTIAKSSDLPELVNRNLKQCYLTKNPQTARLLLKSEFSKYIDLNKKDNSIFEFVCLLKDPNLEETTFFVNWAKDNNQFQYIKMNEVWNSLLSAIQYNKVDLVKYLMLEENFPKVDYSYANYALITQCFPKSNSREKEEIFKFFINEGGLKKNEEIEKILKNLNKLDAISWFEKIELYKHLNQSLNISRSENKKYKL